MSEPTEPLTLKPLGTPGCCCDGFREARCRAAVAEMERDACSERMRGLEDVARDMCAVLLGWGMKMNELGGCDPADLNAYPMAKAKGFVDQLHALGVEL